LEVRGEGIVGKKGKRPNQYLSTKEKREKITSSKVAPRKRATPIPYQKTKTTALRRSENRQVKDRGKPPRTQRKKIKIKKTGSGLNITGLPLKNKDNYRGDEKKGEGGSQY